MSINLVKLTIFLGLSGILYGQSSVLTSPSGNQHVIQPANTTLGVNSLNGQLNAALFSGMDIGAQVNAAWASTSDGCGKVFIPKGSYSFSTTIVMNKPCQSLSGDTRASTILNYTGSGDAILWQMNSFTIASAGSIQNLSIIGTSSGSNGIHTGSVIGSRLEDVSVSGFNGSSGKCIYTENVNGGWYERNTWSGVELGSPSSTSGCTYDWYLKATTGTNSVGYNHFLGVDLNVNSDTYGIYVAAGTTNIFWYNGELITHCNAAGGSCIYLENTANINSLLVSLTGENDNGGAAANGIYLSSGSQFTGCGNISYGGASMTGINDQNLPSSGTDGGGLFLNLCNAVSPNYAGTVSDWDGTGSAATLYPVAIPGPNQSNAEGFGVAVGPNIASAFVELYGGAPNIFSVRARGYNQPWSVGSNVWSADTGGNTNQLGSVNATGYSVSGTSGFTGTKTAGSCVLTIRSGIITNVSGC